MRAVLDTNVELRALFRRTSGAWRIIEALLDGRFTLVTHEDLLAELQEVLARPKIRRKYHLTPDRATELLTILRQQSEFVDREPLASPLCRDPKDEMFLEVAVAGRADFLVTEDKDLLSLQELVARIHGIRIVTVIQFLQLLDPGE